MLSRSIKEMRFAFRSEMTKRSQIMLTLQWFSHKHWLKIGRGIPERRYFSSPMSGNNRSSGQSRRLADARGPCGRPPQACDHDEINKTKPNSPLSTGGFDFSTSQMGHRPAANERQESRQIVIQMLSLRCRATNAHRLTSISIN